MWNKTVVHYFYIYFGLKVYLAELICLWTLKLNTSTFGSVSCFCLIHEYVRNLSQGIMERLQVIHHSPDSRLPVPWLLYALSQLIQNYADGKPNPSHVMPIEVNSGKFQTHSSMTWNIYIFITSTFQKLPRSFGDTGTYVIYIWDVRMYSRLVLFLCFF